MAQQQAKAAKVDFDEVVKQVGANTMLALFPLWMQSWASNLNLARFGDSLDKLYSRPASKRVLVVGRGPSIHKFGHLDLLAKHPFPGEVVASDGALPLRLEKGIIPYLSMTVDGSEVIAKWFNDPVTARYGNKVNAVLPVTAHPKTVAAARRIGAHIYWYIPELDAEPMKGITEMLQLQTYSPRNTTGLSRHNGAGNCGLSALVIACSILRAKEVVMIGMDGGYPPDTDLKQLHYHDALMKACGYSAEQTAQLYRLYANEALGYTIVDPIFEVYRNVFLSLAAAAKAGGVRIVNATEGGCLVADGVEVVKFTDYLAR